MTRYTAKKTRCPGVLGGFRYTLGSDALEFKDRADVVGQVCNGLSFVLLTETVDNFEMKLRWTKKRNIFASFPIKLEIGAHERIECGL